MSLTSRKTLQECKRIHDSLTTTFTCEVLDSRSKSQRYLMQHTCTKLHSLAQSAQMYIALAPKFHGVDSFKTALNTTEAS